MTGVQDVVFRIPEDWDAEWFQGIIQDMFQYADARNVIGVGIIITGTTDVVATYAVDDQNLDIGDGGQLKALVAAMRGRLELLELQVQRGMVRDTSLRKRIEELELSEQVVPANSLKKRIEQLELDAA